MVRTITPLSKIPQLEISLAPKVADPPRSKVVTKGVEELILHSGSAVAYGFREESSGGALSVKPLRFTLPLVISDDFAEALDEIARKLGDQEYSPVCVTAEGFQIYVRVIMSRDG